jgi:hypothetical protein
MIGPRPRSEIALVSENGADQPDALMADHKLDAVVYATFDHSQCLLHQTLMTKPIVDDDRLGNNPPESDPGFSSDNSARRVHFRRASRGSCEHIHYWPADSI